MAADSTWNFSKELGYNTKFQINQAIEKRAGLLFNYGGTHDSGMATMKRWLPFYENPQIVESRKSNYASTDIFLRNEPVRLFTGADARQFRVEIHYTLIHMASMIPTQHILKMFSDDQRLDTDQLQVIESYVRAVIARDTNSEDVKLSGNAAQLARAVQAVNGTPLPPTAPSNPYSNEYPDQNLNIGALNNIADNQKGYSVGLLNAASQRQADGTDGPFGPLPNNVQSQWNDALVYTMGTQSGYAKLASLFQYVINHIRASVIGSGGVGTKGPPIVQLKYGAMYDFVPCIVKDYRLQPVEDAGYDTKSLFSQRLKVSLTLEEMRNVHGNQWGDPSITGSLPGWSHILANGCLPNPIPSWEGKQDDATAALAESNRRKRQMGPPSQGFEF
jgi:hypothetical protein